MSIIETPKANGPREESYRLRLELKEWEKSFAEAHSGRKAGREDIKQHLDIAHKYKRYNKLRAVSSQQLRSFGSTKRNTSPAQRESLQSPKLKRQKVSQPVHPATIDPYDSPRRVHQTPKHDRNCVGPTPQKDGRVLGLFDLLSPASSNLKTPSKNGLLASFNAYTFTTPSKWTPASEEVTAISRQASGRRPSKSPISASKRTYLDSFLTPSAQRLAAKGTPVSRSGVSKIRFDETPNFLRRDSQRTWTRRHTEDGNNRGADQASPWSPVAVRRRPKLAGRGLSALVKGLRDMEDEKLDEEMDVLREMEAGDNTVERSQAVLKPPSIAVEDSQVLEMPLGPDGDKSSGDDTDGHQSEAKGSNGEPLKVWKKKGQKRTTRKTNIKPSNAKWKPEPEWRSTKDQDAMLEQPALVAETQFAEPTEQSPEGHEESDSTEYLDKDPLDGIENLKAVKVTAKAKDKPPKSAGEAALHKKKVSATAHANFRALKIKNKQSRAKRGARFGRGRR